MFAIFKMLFGHPQMLIVQEIKDDDVKPSSDKKKLIKKLSSIYNNDLEDLDD